MNSQDKRSELIRRMKENTQGTSEQNSAVVEAKNHPSEETGKAIPEPIAIIGLSANLPKSIDINAFWNSLDRDESLLQEIPSSRIDWTGKYDPQDKSGQMSHTKTGGVIPDITGFDARFFGILPSEANLMDPRKRLLLMSVYHALEDAGYAPQSLAKSETGVFVAVEEDEYQQKLRAAGIQSDSGNSSSLIANQLSYFFDFRGPSEFVNTMCSGAAVAIHRAVNALRTGEITSAVVGAANLLISSDPFVFLSRTGQMSSSDTVHSFGEKADGYL
ncbi:MAG: polyketide synthase, partial [Bacteroidota bacterium]